MKPCCHDRRTFQKFREILCRLAKKFKCAKGGHKINEEVERVRQCVAKHIFTSSFLAQKCETPKCSGWGQDVQINEAHLITYVHAHLCARTPLQSRWHARRAALRCSYIDIPHARRGVEMLMSDITDMEESTGYGGGAAC